MLRQAETDKHTDLNTDEPILRISYKLIKNIHICSYLAIIMIYFPNWSGSNHDETAATLVSKNSLYHFYLKLKNLRNISNLVQINPRFYFRKSAIKSMRLFSSLVLSGYGGISPVWLLFPKIQNWVKMSSYRSKFWHPVQSSDIYLSS